MWVGQHKHKKTRKIDDREQLFFGNKKKYKQLRVEVRKPNHQWQMDLMDMKSLERYNSHTRYLLVVMDVYSRYVWVKKLRNKNAYHVGNKFKEIMRRMLCLMLFIVIRVVNFLRLKI